MSLNEWSEDIVIAETGEEPVFSEDMGSLMSIVDDAEQVILVIEFGGAYDTARVKAFHQDCVSRNLPYQLW